MKKWLIALCCILIAGIVAFVTVLNNSNARIDTLNEDLGGLQAEYNSLKEKSEKDEKKIEELNLQVENLTAENGTLIAENGALAAENGQLNETLEGLNRNLSSSEQKLQGVMYILTDGERGSIDSLLSPYIKIFQDVPLDDPYFEAVSYANEHQLMAPLEEEVFGAAEKATLGEFAEGLYALQGKAGTRAEAVSALLETEKAWQAAQEPAEEAETAEETTAEEAAETAEEAAETVTEEVAETSEAVEETAEAAAEEAAETVEEATETAEETADATEEAAAEEAAPEIAAEPAEDENTLLTKERMLTLAGVYCFENGKELPEIIFPETAAEEAVRGDLAIVLSTLAQIK